MEELDLLAFEKELYKEGITLIAGVDEVGRGPLCGPVVDKLYEILIKDTIYGIGIVSPQRIDEINILEASKEAMKIALSNLSKKPEHVLIDAVKLDIDIPSTSIIKGDAKSLSIAAASVIAKVTRDRMMYDLDKIYPEYGYASHKGYPTKKHIEAVKKYGVKDFYRFTFSPISEIIKEYKN